MIIIKCSECNTTLDVEEKNKPRIELQQTICPKCIVLKNLDKKGEKGVTMATQVDLMLEKIKKLQTHQERHIFLHKYLDELLADFIMHTEKLPSKTTLVEFMEWSYSQTLNLTE